MNLPFATVRQTEGEFETPGILFTTAFQIGSLPTDGMPNCPPPPTGRFVCISLRAIVLLVPAMRIRLTTLRMQVLDDGPIGSTPLFFEDDGLTIDRPLVVKLSMGGSSGGRDAKGSRDHAGGYWDRPDNSGIGIFERRVLARVIAELWGVHREAYGILVISPNLRLPLCVSFPAEKSWS